MWVWQDYGVRQLSTAFVCVSSQQTQPHAGLSGCLRGPPPALPRGDSLLPPGAALPCTVGLLLPLPSACLYAGMLLLGLLLLLAACWEWVRCAAIASSAVSNPLKSCQRHVQDRTVMLQPLLACLQASTIGTLRMLLC